MEAILDELLNTALSPQVAADPATGTEKLVASHSKEIHRVPYYQLAAQAEQRLVEQQKQSGQALHDQAAAAAAASEAAVADLRKHHQAEASSLAQSALRATLSIPHMPIQHQTLPLTAHSTPPGICCDCTLAKALTKHPHHHHVPSLPYV